MNHRGVSIFLSLASCFTFVYGCSNESTEEHQPGNALTFDSYLDARSGVIDGTNNTITTDGGAIGVFAKHTNGAGSFSSATEETVFSNQQVTFDDNLWSYSPLAYWSVNSYNFFAYYPHSTGTTATLTCDTESANSSSSRAMTLSKYAIPDTSILYVSNQKDLLLATPVMIQGTKDRTEPVPLTFKHALSAVSFTLTPQESWDESLYTAELLQVQIAGIYTAGVVSVDNEGKISWNLADQTKEMNGLRFDFTTNNGVYSAKPRLLIPQTLTSEASLILYIKETNGANSVIKAYSLPISTSQVTQWSVSSTYNYTLTLVQNVDLNSYIDVEITIADWIDITQNITWS